MFRVYRLWLLKHIFLFECFLLRNFSLFEQISEICFHPCAFGPRLRFTIFYQWRFFTYKLSDSFLCQMSFWDAWPLFFNICFNLCDMGWHWHSELLTEFFLISYPLIFYFLWYASMFRLPNLLICQVFIVDIEIVSEKAFFHLGEYIFLVERENRFFEMVLGAEI